MARFWKDLASRSDRIPDHNGTPERSSRISKEDATVAQLLKERLERLPEPKDEGVHKAFAEVEFERRLREYQKSATRWRVAQVVIWLTIASLGLLGSVLAAVESGHIIAVVAGSLVAILTTFTQAAHPGRQADGYNNARREIRDEAWDLLNGTGDYEGETDAQAFKRFTQRIREIVNLKRSATQLQMP